jgi:hypothetical protein
MDLYNNFFTHYELISESCEVVDLRVNNLKLYHNHFSDDILLIEFTLLEHDERSIFGGVDSKLTEERLGIIYI